MKHFCGQFLKTHSAERRKNMFICFHSIVCIGGFFYPEFYASHEFLKKFFYRQPAGFFIRNRLKLDRSQLFFECLISFSIDRMIFCFSFFIISGFIASFPVTVFSSVDIFSSSFLYKRQKY